MENGLTAEETEYFLKYICAALTDYLSKSNISLVNLCGDASNILSTLFKSLNIPCFVFNLRDLTHDLLGLHSVILSEIPQISNHGKNFILDVTFRQFCLKDGCQINGCDCIIPPEPGYYLAQDDAGVRFGTKLITDGYFELTEDNFKLYCDAFQYNVNARLHRDSLCGIRSGSEYIHDMWECREKVENYNIDDIFPALIKTKRK